MVRNGGPYNHDWYLSVEHVMDLGHDPVDPVDPLTVRRNHEPRPVRKVRCKRADRATPVSI